MKPCSKHSYPPFQVFPLVLELEPLPARFSFFLLPREHFHISNQVFRLGMEEESMLNEMKLGGHCYAVVLILGPRSFGERIES